MNDGTLRQPGIAVSARRYVNGFNAGVFFGVLLLLLSVTEPSVYSTTAGIFVVIGSLVCLSAQKRQSGSVTNSTTRRASELSALFLATVLHFTHYDIYRLVVESPVAHAMTVAWAYTAFLYFNFPRNYDTYKPVKLTVTAVTIFVAVPVVVGVLNSL